MTKSSIVRLLMLLALVGSSAEGPVPATASSASDSAHPAEAAFAHTEPEAWMTNSYGAEDVVLPGFEPLHADGTTVTMWGRIYRFDQAIMPRQITNQKRDMLAQPINWFLNAYGRTSSLRVNDVKLVSASPTRAVYQGTGRLATLSVQATVTVEYDGFMKFDIAFDPGKKPLSVDWLWMDVPLVPAESTNMYHPTRRSGLWQNGWKSKLVFTRTNIITLGTPDISLQWLTESDQYYYPRDYGEAVETLNDKGASVFRTNVIAKSKIIDRPFKLTFALHAGPVRPRPANWRGWTAKGRQFLDPARHTSIRAYYFQGEWCNTPGSLVPQQGFPAKRTPDMFKDRIDATSMHFAGFRHFKETNLQKRLPEWEKHEAEWERIPRRIKLGTKPGWNEQTVDTNSSWGQWHVYNCYKLFSLTGFRGLYYDDWRPGVSMNALAGSGYVDENGIRRPIAPIFSQREIHRRVYAIVKRFRPNDGIIIIHTASSILLPIVSFCDVIYDGEIMGWQDLVPPEGDYFQTFRNDLFQMVFSCKNYGPVCCFHDMTMTYLGKEGMGKTCTMHNQRKLWAKWLTHDIQAYSGFTCGSEELLYYWLDHFDIADPNVEFHSYWQPAPPVKVLRGYWPHGDDKASKMWAVAYSKPGAVLVVVVRDAPNNYGGPATIDVQLDRKRLGLPVGALKSLDLETLSRTEKGIVEGDILKIPVEADDFSAVVIRTP